MFLDGLDKLDRAIVQLLIGNARMSYSELGERTGISRVAAKMRVRSLEQRGVIEGYTTIVNPQRIGGALSCYFEIETRPETLEEAIRQLKENETVTQIYRVTGRDRLHVHAVALLAGGAGIVPRERDRPASRRGGVLLRADPLARQGREGTPALTGGKKSVDKRPPPRYTDFKTAFGREENTMKNGRCKVVLVGLGFGGAFAPIWKDHPAVTSFGICDLDRGLAEKVAKLYGIESVYDSFEDVLADPEVDAVHLVTTIPGTTQPRRCACCAPGSTAPARCPMATSLEDVQAILDAERESGKHFMMMETTLYTYQFRYVQKMLRSGEMGRIQFLRGSHYQDMENWPAYWKGLPPFWYGTPRRRAAGRAGRRADHARVLPRLRHDARGAARRLRQPLSHRNGALCVCERPCGGGDALAV